MPAAARHRPRALAALPLAAALLLLAILAPAAAQARIAPRPRIVFIRCSSVPFPCTSHKVFTRTGRMLVGASRMSRRAKVEFPVRPKGRKAGRRAVGGTFRTRTRLVVRVPGDAVSGFVRVVNPGRRTSNAVRIAVRRPPPPPPPIVSGTPSAFDGNGMWIWYLSKSQGGDPAAIGAQAQAYGIRTVYVKSADGVNVWSQFSADAVAALKAQGLRVCAWQFVYGDDPLGEAAAAATAATAGADCFVIDAEGAYEGKYAQAQRYMAKLRELVGPTFPIALTSFPYVDYHPGLPFSVFLAPGAASFNLPQVYWKTIGTSVDTALAHTYAWNTPYDTAAIFPLGQTYESPPAGDVVRFRQLSTSYGARGVSWWDWQETTDAGWTALAAPVDPLAATTTPQLPTLSAGTGGKVGSKGDLVVWAQEHLAGAGQPIVADGAYGQGTADAASAFQQANGLPVTGQVDAATWPVLLRVTPAMRDWVAVARARSARTAGAARAGDPSVNGPSSAGLPAKRYEIPPGPRP